MFYFCNISIGKGDQLSFQSMNFRSFVEMVNLKVFEPKKLVYGIRKILVGNVYISIDLV